MACPIQALVGPWEVWVWEAGNTSPSGALGLTKGHCLRLRAWLVMVRAAFRAWDGGSSRHLPFGLVPELRGQRHWVWDKRLLPLELPPQTVHVVHRRSSLAGGGRLDFAQALNAQTRWRDLSLLGTLRSSQVWAG